MRTAVNARLARTVATVVAAAAAWLLAAGLASPAQAGGPTSVLLVVPGGGGTAALYYDDPDYAELARLVGANGASPVADVSGRGQETGSQVTVTWLIHDVQVWRVDRIYLGGPDGPWVASQVGADGDIWDAPVFWQRPAQPKALLALLDRLGLDATGGDVGTPPAEAQPAPLPFSAEAGSPPANQQETPAPDQETPWLLLGVAALGGALAAVAATLPLARRAAVGTSQAVGTTAPDEAVTEVDRLDGDTHGTDDGWSPAEELATRP